MRYIEVSKASRLGGTICVQGSKNSTLALMAASCLSGGTVVLENIPDISDIHIFINILKSFGAKAGFIDNSRIIIKPAEAHGTQEIMISPEYTRKVRPSYYFIGSLLTRYKKITLGYPGGDSIGKRPIDQHIKGLEAMGAHFEFYDDFYTVSADRLTGTDIYFDLKTGGATLNLIMAAVLAKGRTTLYNAAKDPEVVDTAIMLNKMGAKIFGAGTDTIRIDGVDSLTGCSHYVIPDRLIAGTYVIAAGIAGGCIKLDNIIPEHLKPLTQKLQETGMEFVFGDSSVTAICSGSINPIEIKAGKFPMLETDFQQSAAALLLKANGTSTITDMVYPERVNHCKELRKLGASIECNNGVTRINGGKPLTGTLVHAGDIRAGACLVLAGLLAEGTTHIGNIEHIERGYPDIISDLSSVGANLKIVNGEFYSDEEDGECLPKNAAVK